MSVTKQTNRKIRRAVGQDVADVVAFNEARVELALGILRRGFIGRLKWLLLGR